MKITKVMSYLLSIVVLISIAIGVNGCMSEQDEILEYLEEKYGQKFEVERYWSEYVGTRESANHILVYPKGKPELIFQAEKFWDTLKKKSTFEDSYVQAKWSVDFTKKNKAKILRLDGRDIEVSLVIGVPGEPSPKQLQTDMEQYLQESGMGVRPSGTVLVAIKCEKEPSKKQEAELTYEIYQLVKVMDFDVFHIEVIFVKPNSFKEAKRLLYLKQADPMIPLEAVGKENFYYVVYLLGSDNITGPQDIVKRFRTGE